MWGRVTIDMPLLTELSEADGDMKFSGQELGTEGRREKKMQKAEGRMRKMSAESANATSKPHQSVLIANRLRP